MLSSAIDANRGRMKKEAVTGGAFGLFCAVFTVIYELFSHGAYSPHMRGMLLFPLVGCGLIGLVCYLTPLWRYVGRWTFNFWNAAMGTLTLGFLFRGIVNISGRFTKVDRVYTVLGCGLIAVSLLFELLTLIKRRKAL